MLSTLSRRIVARGLRPSPLALHRVRMCQSAAAQPEVKVTIEEPAAARSDDETAEVALEKALRPKEIVEQLDRYIIGQPEAKRAVAVAMRNRWRRQRVASPLKEEVCCRTPSLPHRPCHASMRAPDGTCACYFPADLAEEHLDDRPDWQGRVPHTWATLRGPTIAPRRPPGPGTSHGTAQARARARARAQSRAWHGTGVRECSGFAPPAWLAGGAPRAEPGGPHLTRASPAPHATRLTRHASRAQAAARPRWRAASRSSHRRPLSRSRRSVLTPSPSPYPYS